MNNGAYTKAVCLRAFESLLIETGEREATLEAVARRAGVSKGGLLHHFANKSALVDAQLERLAELVRVDVELMMRAPEGRCSYFLRMALSKDSSLNRAITAVMRLGEAHGRARTSLAEVQLVWADVLTEELGPEVALAVRYVGNGLYFRTKYGGEQAAGVARNEDLAVIAKAFEDLALHDYQRLKRPSPARIGIND